MSNPNATDNISQHMRDYEAKNLARNERRKKLYMRNKVLLVQAIQALGIEAIAVEFEGSGDSGQIESICVYGATITSGEHVGKPIEIDTETKVTRVHGERYELVAGEGIQTVPGTDEPQECTLRELIEEIVDYLTDFNVCGTDWCNNDGGFGHWRYSLEEGFDFEVHYRVIDDNIGCSSQAESLHEWIQQGGDI